MSLPAEPLAEIATPKKYGLLPRPGRSSIVLSVAGEGKK